MPAEDLDTASWEQYHQLIMSELKSHGDTLQRLDEKIDDLRTTELTAIKINIAELEVRSGVFGAVAGFLAAAVPIVAALALKIIYH